MGATSAGGIAAIAGRSRAWLVGFMVWAIALVGLGVSSEDGTGLAAADGAAALFLYLLIVSMVRIAWPMRIVGRHADRLIGGGKSYAVNTFTGRTHSVDRNIASSTHVTGTIYSDAVGDVHGSIGSQTTHSVNDRFSLLAEDGREHTVQVSDASVPLGAGQLVAAAWAIAPGRAKGRYFLFHNHSTGVTTFAPKGIYKIVYGGSVGLAVIWWLTSTLFLGVAGHGRAAAFAGLGGAVLLVVGTRLQAAFFRSVGSRPLVTRLRQGEEAELLTGQASDPAPRPLVAPTGPVAPLAPVAPFAPPATGSSQPRPGPQPSLPPPPPPAQPTTMAWRNDPTGRHEYRYWDGAAWTDHVSDQGVGARDALP